MNFTKLRKDPKGLKGYTYIVGRRGEYIVTKGSILKRFPVWRCTCASYAFNNGKECKHIKQVKASL